MNAVCHTPSSDGAFVNEVSSNFLERIKSYSPGKQKVNGRIWHLTLNCDLDLGVRVMKSVCDTRSSDGACVYEVSSNYLERINSYGRTDRRTDVPTE
jgi:hypothetical protein